MATALAAAGGPAGPRPQPRRKAGHCNVLRREKCPATVSPKWQGDSGPARRKVRCVQPAGRWVGGPVPTRPCPCRGGGSQVDAVPKPLPQCLLEWLGDLTMHEEQAEQAGWEMSGQKLV